VEESGNAPFAAGRLLFSLNGFVDGFRGGLGVELQRRVTPARAAGILGAADSEVLFALLLDRLDAGEPPTDALAGLVTALAAEAGGRLNLLLADGEQVWATRWGNSLFVADGPASGAAVVASEPLDRTGSWREVPEKSLVHVTRASVDIQPL
jgi:gamma-glutamyl hercynylcysteine S-oxide hydrolase